MELGTGHVVAPLAAAVERVRAYATGSWAIATGHVQLVEPQVVAGQRGDTVVVQARLDAASVSAQALDRLAASLVADGWGLDRSDGAVARLDASRTGVVLEATHDAGAGALVLRVRSTPIPVADGTDPR